MSEQVARKNWPGVGISSIVKIVVAAAAVIILCIYLFQSKYRDKLDRIEASYQQVGSVTVVNYQPVFAEGVNWSELEESEREGLARYATKQAIEKAKKEGVTSFNVIGIGRERNASSPLFLYTSGDKVDVFSGGRTLRVALRR